MIMKILGNLKYVSLFLLGSIATYSQPLKVFVLAGQSNMQGHCYVEPEPTHITKNGGMGTLRYMVDNDTAKIYGGLTNSTGEWVIRNDVWIYYDKETDGILKGDLTVGAGVNDTRLGPEFGFGLQVGDYYENQVLLIKTAWGGKSLNTDFQPPSQGGPGTYYALMQSTVTDVLSQLKTHFPSYADQGHEIVGFGWHQGWNDAGDDAVAQAYEGNLEAFIIDVRKDFNAADMAFVVGLSGHNGWTRGPGFRGRIWDFLQPAQYAVSNDTTYPDFAGNVATAETRDFWFESAESPGNSPSHYNNNGETMFKIGDTMGKEMVGLLKVIDPNTGINLVSQGKSNITIFENQLKIEQMGEHILSIFNVSGKLIFRKKGNDNQAYDVSQILKMGMYFLNLETKWGNYQQKILVH